VECKTLAAPRPISLDIGHSIGIMQRRPGSQTQRRIFVREPSVSKVDATLPQPTQSSLISELTGGVGTFVSRCFGVKTERTTKHSSRLRPVTCPSCKAQFQFRRAAIPRFDAHGFESYGFLCESCRISLIGVIDPLDGALLLTTVNGLYQ